MEPPWDPGKVNHPERDKRVGDTDRFVHDRRTEALAMIRLWKKSTKRDAGDELRCWRMAHEEIASQAGQESSADGLAYSIR
jgi:hypothetical protein